MLPCITIDWKPYVSNATRPDLMYIVFLISIFMISSIGLHLRATKRVLRYLTGTVDLGVYHRKMGNRELITYIDSDYIEDIDDMKITSSYVFLLSDEATS